MILAVEYLSRSLDFPQEIPTKPKPTDTSPGADNSHSTIIHWSKIHGKRMEVIITETLRMHLRTTGHRTSSVGRDLLDQQRVTTSQIKMSVTSRKKSLAGMAEALLLMGVGILPTLPVPGTRFRRLRVRKDSHRVVLRNLRVPSAQNLVCYSRRHIKVRDHASDD